MLTEFDRTMMVRALELAHRGAGAVEPNPQVGCVIVQGTEVVGEGWHERYGGPHAEVRALAAAGPRASGGTLYVTLEPCCHFGKTPPCTRAVLAAGVRRVVMAMRDPFPAVSGGGEQELRQAGIDVEVGLEESPARELNAPYLKLQAFGQPWVIAKWAMTLDGKIATRTGDSQWISGEASRQTVHELRGRVDAIWVGRGTVERDDPLLTARPPGPRVATRVVLDRQARIPVTCQLCRTARDVPVLVVVSEEAPVERTDELRRCGCEVLALAGASSTESLEQLLVEFGRRRWTNVLVEGGSRLLGSLLDAQLVDEVRAYVAPKIFGGVDAPGAVGGRGVARLADATQWRCVAVERLGDDTMMVVRRR